MFSPDYWYDNKKMISIDKVNFKGNDIDEVNFSKKIDELRFIDDEEDSIEKEYQHQNKMRIYNTGGDKHEEIKYYPA